MYVSLSQRNVIKTVNLLTIFMNKTQDLTSRNAIPFFIMVQKKK